MKKQRSASPSQAIPRSAPLGAHRVDDQLPVLLAAAGSARGRGTRRRARSRCSSRSRPSRSSIGPTIGPAMPLPPSTTTFSGLDRRRVDEGEHVARGTPRRCRPPRASRRRARRRGRASISRAHVADPGVAGERQRALAHQLDAGVGLRVVGGGDHRAAVELARADQVVEHLGADHAGVEHRAPPRRPARRAAPPPSPARAGACRGRGRPAARRAACRAARPARARTRGRRVRGRPRPSRSP